jgi:hypothetical protein
LQLPPQQLAVHALGARGLKNNTERDRQEGRKKGTMQVSHVRANVVSAQGKDEGTKKGGEGHDEKNDDRQRGREEG